ncbi:MAG: hypothetical protein CMA12_07615 [Euryarchaeota archaeon]|nr:hypothetical protein [Euryarchaeota archaeon]
MKILHVINGLNMGGAEQNLLNLLKNSHNSTFNHTVVSLSDEGVLGKEIKKLNIKIYCLNINKNSFFLIKILRYFISIFRLSIIIKKNKSQIVQTWLHQSDLLGLICCFLIRHKNLIWSIRCSFLKVEFISFKNIILMKVLGIFSKFPKIVLFNSYLGYRAHTQIGYSPKKYKIIYNGVDTSKFKPDLNLRKKIRKKLNIKDRIRVIGYVGKYEKIKDINTFLLSVKCIQEKFENSMIIMIGKNLDYKNKILAKEIQDKQLNNFHLLGNVININEMILSFDLLLLTSKSEGMPNVLIESMASGIGCISTNVGDVKKILDNNYICEVGDYKGICKASIKYLGSFEDSRNKLIKNNIKKISNNYNILNISKQYEIIYRELIANG